MYSFNESLCLGAEMQILACGWCGGCIELFIGTVLAGGLGFVFPELKRLFSRRKCKDCCCEVNSQSEDLEPSQ